MSGAREIKRAGDFLIDTQAIRNGLKSNQSNAEIISNRHRSGHVRPDIFRGTGSRFQSSTHVNSAHIALRALAFRSMLTLFAQEDRTRGRQSVACTESGRPDRIRQHGQDRSAERPLLRRADRAVADPFRHRHGQDAARADSRVRNPEEGRGAGESGPRKTFRRKSQADRRRRPTK